MTTPTIPHDPAAALAEARERLRRIYIRNERYESVYGQPQTGGGLMNIDEEVVVLADLAAHPPDDGEPLSDEWLISVGGVWEQGQAAYRIMLGSRQMLRIRTNGRYWLVDLGTTGGQFHPYGRKQSRGEVRRLTLALGIPLTEQPHA